MCLLKRKQSIHFSVVSAVLFAVASSFSIHDNSVKDDCGLVFLFFAKLKCICKKKINNTTRLFQEQKQSV